jgi:hypothetical protein
MRHSKMAEWMENVEKVQKILYLKNLTILVKAQLS